jgi:hypothetical protein
VTGHQLELLHESVEEKAQRLLSENRVFLASSFTAFVAGDTGQRKVTATINGTFRSCPSRVKCSHILAALARWDEARESPS